MRSSGDSPFLVLLISDLKPFQVEIFHTIVFRKYGVHISILTPPQHGAEYPDSALGHLVTNCALLLHILFPIRVGSKHFKEPRAMRSYAFLYQSFPIYPYLLHLLFHYQPKKTPTVAIKQCQCNCHLFCREKQQLSPHRLRISGFRLQ